MALHLQKLYGDTGSAAAVGLCGLCRQGLEIEIMQRCCMYTVESMHWQK